MATNQDIDRKMPTSCTLEEFMGIITADTGGMTMLPSDTYNEVYPNLYIGDESIAHYNNQLKHLGITHIINAALGRNTYCVYTGPSLYKDLGITFLGIEAMDLTACDLSVHFEETAEFIDNALNNGGKVLVHCKEGVSRSATLVLAFLMIKRNMTVQTACRTVRQAREICPNDGFILQLCRLNDELLAKNDV